MYQHLNFFASEFIHTYYSRNRPPQNPLARTKHQQQHYKWSFVRAYQPNCALEFRPQNMSPSSNIYLQICVFAALLLALIANNNLLVQASPQFSVFNRQLFPSFSFPSFSRPSRPTFNSVQRPQQRPSVFRPAPSPAPIVTRIVTTTVAPATTTRTTAATLIR